MARFTTAYYTLEIERYGRSGPENERLIEKYVQSLDGDNPKDKRMAITVQSHQYESFTESVE